MGVPGCPDSAFCTASMDSVRMVLIESCVRSISLKLQGRELGTGNREREARNAETKTARKGKREREEEPLFPFPPSLQFPVPGSQFPGSRQRLIGVLRPALPEFPQRS